VNFSQGANPVNRFPTILPVLVPAAILIIPYSDFLLAVIRRTLKRQSPFSADKLHLHHRMLNIGHSHRAPVLLETGQGLSMDAVALRSATPADSGFCYQLHKDAMGSYVTAVWGWDEQVQREFHDRAFHPERWQIITVGGVDAGVLNVEYRPSEVYLARIEVHPSYQGHGIGAHLIGVLVADAGRRRQDVVIEVLSVNHRA
jgi:GNAT superfamily N-acetyltransferase